ncbi:MAG: GTPase Era [Alphaproteobacteria bacterium]|nr:MAG: GTPase Era [Alphaproteobacteria bacterium]
MNEPIKTCGFIALLGAPNAGKSTLLNNLIGQKISIVTQKVQTTRARIRGICMEGNAQLVFIDTPGIFQPKRRLDRAMVSAAWGGAGEADVIAVLVDAERGIDGNTKRILDGLQKSNRKAVLIVNKIDLVKKQDLLNLTKDLAETNLFTEVFMVSALTGDGVADLRTYFASNAPTGPWMYPEDQLSDVSERLIAAEITREKLFLRVHQELPYAATVETVNWYHKKDGSIRIDQVVFVERESQKGIVLGKGGRTIKDIGVAAREELQELFDCKVHLFIQVKVRKNWSNERQHYREMGLDFTD